MNKKQQFLRSLLPNALTSLSAMCGLGSMVAAKDGIFDLAALLILLAAICDALDGIMARLLKASSRFGVELDSLVDCVSFGAAPAFLIYNAYLFKFGIPGLIISSFLLIFGAFRLARFNVELVGYDKDYFTGLPIPFSAITLGAFVYAFTFENNPIAKPYDEYVIPLVILLSIIMVSKIKYPVLPKPKLSSLKKNKVMLIYALISVVFLAATSLKNVFYILIIFIFTGIIRTTYKFIITYGNKK